MSSSDVRTTRATTARTTRATRATVRRRSTAAPPAPVVLDRYRLQQRLGTGAFGTVWMARDERLERDVAVKILARERIVGGRFEREARAAARLSHPAIVTLYEAAVDDEGAYLVSELVRGATLGALLADGHLSDRDIVSVALALCDALEHAHDQGIVHRDVKPSNVLVPDAPSSTAQVAKLTDFGVARVLGGDTLTMTGDVLGTLAYMAPEQAEGLEAGPAADLYSLALVIYEALSGVNPVAMGATQRSRRLGTQLPPLRRQRRDLPRELGSAIDLALRPRPRERGSVGELRDALLLVHDEVGDEPGVVAGPVSPWPTLRTQAEGAGLGGATAEHRLWGPSAPADRTATRVARDPESGADEPADPLATPRPWPARGLAAAGAAALAAWLTAVVLAPAPVPPPLAALVAGGAVLLLPRLGWLALVAATALGAVIAGDPGTALVLAIALLIPVALLPARPTLWPVAAGAPALGLLGLAGLAGAWPALAGRAGSPWRRAAVAALGWIWLAAAGLLAGRALYLGAIPGIPGRGAWAGSAPAALHQVLATLISSGALAPALVWAAAAVVVPWLVRGRRPGLDVARAVLWAALTAALISAAIDAAHIRQSLYPAAGAPPGLLIGALAAAAVALAPLIGPRLGRSLRSGSSRGRLP